LTVERAVIGLFSTGVKLSNGIAGACATPIKTIPEAVCCPTSAMAMPFPGKLRGRPALDLADEALGDHGIRRAVGIAAMNALADTSWRRRPHPQTELRLGIDAFDATEMRPGDPRSSSSAHSRHFCASSSAAVSLSSCSSRTRRPSKPRSCLFSARPNRREASCPTPTCC
jgi:hypothetical protein